MLLFLDLLQISTPKQEEEERTFKPGRFAFFPRQRLIVRYIIECSGATELTYIFQDQQDTRGET